MGSRMTTGRFWLPDDSAPATIQRLAGSGAEQVAVELAGPNDRVAGEVVGMALRQTAAGTATAADFYLVCGPKSFEDYGNDVANIPEEYIIFKDTGSTLTGSATACFVGPAPVGDANYHPCTSGRLYLVADVQTASGDWEFHGCIDVR